MNLRQAQRRTRFFAALALGLAIVLTVGVFLNMRAGERRRSQLVFERRTDHLAQSLMAALGSYSDILYAIEGLFRASQRVDRGEFAKFVERSIFRYPGIMGRLEGELQTLPGLIMQTGETLRQIEKLVIGMQKHWLLREYVEQQTPVTRIPSAEVGQER